MVIKNLRVVNFRSHDSFEIDFNSEKLAIVGKNGTGKTSLIEAIYVLLRGKSFKNRLSSLVKNGESFYRIEGDFITSDINHRVSKLIINDNIIEKSFEINNQKSKQLLNKYKYPVVLFEPSDLNLITGSPKRRRSFIDELISQIKPEYQSTLRKYERALKQRNSLLKTCDFVDEQILFSWNILLSKYGSQIISERFEFIEQINKLLTSIYQKITGVKDEIKISYSDSLTSNIEQSLFNSLEKNTRFTTTVGPHRHDIIFEFNSSLASESISRGETRGLILSLKIIESILIQENTGIYPLIILDDVLSELDKSRQLKLMNFISKSQIIITTTDAYNLKGYQICETK